MANKNEHEKGESVTSRDASIPKIGAQVQVLRDNVAGDGVYQAAIVVGHLKDPDLGTVLELRLSDSRRLQRTWPTSTIRLSPAG